MNCSLSLRTLTAALVTLLILTGCSSDEPTVVEPPPVVETITETETDTNDEEVIEVVLEPAEPETIVFQPEPEPVSYEVEEDLAETDNSLSEEEALSRARIIGAVTTVTQKLSDGGRKTLEMIDTTDCISLEPNEYRLCTTRTVREAGYDSAKYHDIVTFNDATKYHSVYMVN